jgi:hypothetical protein
MSSNAPPVFRCILGNVFGLPGLATCVLVANVGMGLAISRTDVQIARHAEATMLVDNLTLPNSFAEGERGSLTRCRLDTTALRARAPAQCW